MTEKTRNVVVGLTTLLGLAALGYLIWVLGEVPKWLSDNYVVTIDFDDASGLAAGSRVRLQGVDIGSIEQVTLKTDPSQGVELRCLIDSQYDIPSNATVSAGASLLGGTTALSVSVPKEGAGAPLPKDGTARLRGGATSITSKIEALAANIETALPRQLENFDRVSAKVIEFADTYIAVGRDIRNLIQQRSVADVDAGKATPNLVTVVARADENLAELKKTLAKINELVSDEKLHTDIRQTVANANQVTANAKELTDDGRKFIADAQKNLDELTRRLIALADDAAPSLKRLESLLAEAQEGDGTVAKLVNDPALYDSFQDAADRLSDALKELQLLMQKWKAEGVPVKF